MNRSNLELSMDYFCNHKRVRELSVSRALRTQVAFHLALSQGQRIKVRGSIQGTCEVSSILRSGAFRNRKEESYANQQRQILPAV